MSDISHPRNVCFFLLIPLILGKEYESGFVAQKYVVLLKQGKKTILNLQLILPFKQFIVLIYFAYVAIIYSDIQQMLS